ncbi:LysE family transporter [Sulfurovum sp.]|uniref:LysE family translocator n=1 Tax=Sulfurovum sp. TaxID=1969726 RepID=UPI0028683579|nr:LysE family transporter [Sulfurovum sp.]
MLISFLEGFLLGMGAAIPLGPINILIMNTALRDYKSAVTIGFGALSADTLYLTMILLGLATFFTQPTLLTILGLLGSAFLLYMSYLVFKYRNNILETKNHSRPSKSLIKFYLQGFTLTFVNPYTVAFWLSIAGYTAHKDLDPIITIIGMLCAIFLWVTLMPYFVHRSKHRISQRVSYYLSLFSSIVLLGFGLVLVINMFI